MELFIVIHIIMITITTLVVCDHLGYDKNNKVVERNGMAIAGDLLSALTVALIWPFFFLYRVIAYFLWKTERRNY